MLAIISAIAIFAGIIFFLTGVLPSLVALYGTDGMSESGTATVKGVTPRVFHDAEGNAGAWLDYTVGLEVGGKVEELSVWAPEWYGARKDGTELTLTYNPENPNECMIAEVREAMEGLVPACSKASVALIAVGGMLAIVAALTGI